MTQLKAGLLFLLLSCSLVLVHGGIKDVGAKFCRVVTKGPLPVVVPTLIAQSVKVATGAQGRIGTEFYADKELEEGLGLTQDQLRQYRASEENIKILNLVPAYFSSVALSLEAIGQIQSGGTGDNISPDMRVPGLKGPKSPFFAAALIPRTLQLLNSIAALMCGKGPWAALTKFDEGAALQNGLAYTSKAVKTLKTSISTAARTPFPVVSRPASSINLAMEEPLDEFQRVCDMVDELLSTSCDAETPPLREAPWHTKFAYNFNKALQWPPLKCFGGFMNKLTFSVAILDIATSSASFHITKETNNALRGLELAACIKRPTTAVARDAPARNLEKVPGCSPVTGRRLLGVNGTSHQHAANFDSPLTLDMLVVPTVVSSLPTPSREFVNLTLASNGGRRLQQAADMDLMSAAEAVNVNIRRVLTIFTDVFDRNADLETALKGVGVDKLLSFHDKVQEIVRNLQPTLAPLRVVGDVFGGIGEVLQFIKCPDFLGFICSINDIIGALIDEAAKLITGKSLTAWVQDLLEATGFNKVFDALKDLLPDTNFFKDELDAAAQLIDTLESRLTLMLDEFAKLGALFNPRLFDVTALMLEGAEQQIRPGVLRKLVTASGGAPVSFSCAQQSYPVVNTATRTIWRCTQTLSAFMRFPCGGRGTSGCSVDYHTTWRTDCTDPAVNQAPSAELREDLLGLFNLNTLGVEDNFRAEYFCVGDNVDFKVLSELFDGVVDTKSQEVTPSWWTGQKKYSSKPVLKVDGTLIDKISCNAGRAIYIEYVQTPDLDGFAWNPCFYSPFINSAHKEELCWFKLSNREGRRPSGPAYDDTDTRSDGSYKSLYSKYECAGDASGVYAIARYKGLNRDDSEIQSRFMDNWAACSAEAPLWMRGCSSGGVFDSPPCTIVGCPQSCTGFCAYDQCHWLVARCPCQSASCGTQSLSPNDHCDRAYPYSPRQQALLQAKSIRQQVLTAYAQQDVATTCTDALASCANGVTSCDLKGCVPDALQWSCMEPVFFASGPTQLVYIFGSSKRTKQARIQCPAGLLMRIREADFGEALDFQDVAAQVATMCMSSSCALDITKFNNFDGKVLRVEWECQCGAGFKPAPATGLDGCTKCSPGTYRRPDMTDCAECGSGSFQPDAGQVSCLVCPAGSFAGAIGSSNCSTVPVGYYSAENSTGPTPCAVNSFTTVNGSSSCLPCLLGQSTNGGEASTTCSNCPAGFYRSADMTNCTICPAGSFSNEQASACSPCPAGSYALARGSVECKLCPVGTYQSNEGSTVCLKCPVNSYTAGVGAMSAADCSLQSQPVDYDAIAAKLAANMTANATALQGRRLLQTMDMAVCAALLQMFKANEGELGNGLCNFGPYNTAVCGFDGGDCCESTCQKPANSTLEFSCSPLGFACKDPAAIAAAAKIAVENPQACIPQGTTQWTPEPAGPEACPVPSNDPRLGNGLCEDELNINACGYDMGDCCSTTCKPSLLLGSCAPSTFNCRDKDASIDKVAPTIVAPVALTRTFTWLNESKTTGEVPEAASFDNYPCFVPLITTIDVQIAGADCAASIWYILRRTYTATDSAGNAGTAQATLTVLDDVAPQLLNVPQPSRTTMNSTFVRGGGMANSTRVSATDNSPGCFDGVVQYRQDMVDQPTAPPRVCNSKIVYHLLRTWTTTDGANNRASYQQLVAVRDVEVVSFPRAILSLSRTGTVAHSLRVPDPLPNKQYTWVMTQTDTHMPQTKTKTGSSVAFSVSYSASRPADFVITSGRVLTFTVTIHMDYLNCTGAPFRVMQNVMTVTINVV